MAVLKNRAKMSTSTTGTGTITLGSAESGYQTFADAGVANGDVVRYVIEDGNNFEIGTGTYTSSGTTLTRTVSESSNSDAAINLSGSSTVFIGATAEDIAGGPRGVEFDDNVKVKFGSSGGNELEIYTDGTSSYITESGSSHLNIQGQEIKFKNASGTRLMTLSISQMEVFHSGNKKLETTSSGIQTTGTVNVNNAYTLPTSDGTNGQVLTTNGSGAVTFADAGGGGADLYAANESSPTAQPSATGTNAIAIGDDSLASGLRGMAVGYSSKASGQDSAALGNATASGESSAAVGFYATASGAGAVSIGYSATASGTFAGCLGFNGKATANSSIALGNSYASGEDSLAAVIDNNTSSYGATGANSIAIGELAKATASDSFCISNASTASGTNAAVLGGQSNTSSGSSSTVIGGQSNLASGDLSTAKGYYGNSNGVRLKHSTGVYPNQQGAYYVLGYTTSDATPIALNTSVWTPSSTNQIVLPNNSAFTFSGTIIAREDATDGSDYASWEIKGAIIRDANAASTVLGQGIVNKLYATSGASAWAIDLSADTTFGCLKIQATGAASTNIRWVATVNTSEVTYA